MPGLSIFNALLIMSRIVCFDYILRQLQNKNFLRIEEDKYKCLDEHLYTHLSMSIE